MAGDERLDEARAELERPRFRNFVATSAASPGRALAWDAGTGNGQVAIALTGHLDRVVATDASGDQLARAVAHARVAYRNEPADRVSLLSGSVDLITAGAAAHWFELEGFYREVRRVGKRGAIVALFSYGPRDFAADAVGPIVHRFQDEVLDGFWPERIQYVHDRYATLPFPFDEIAVPPFVAPNPAGEGKEGEIELRQLFELERAYGLHTR